MSVEIKRNTGILGVMHAFKVLVNGAEAERVQNNETIAVEIPGQEAVVQLSQLGVKTKEIAVKDGDCLEVSTVTWGIYSIFAVVIFFSLSRPVAPDIIRYGVVLLFFASAFFINGMFYKIEKVPERVEVGRK